MAIAIIFPILVLLFIPWSGDADVHVAGDSPPAPARFLPDDIHKQHREDRISSLSLLSSPSSLSARILDDGDDGVQHGPDGRCHKRVSTKIIKDKSIIGQGIVFAVRSDRSGGAADDGLKVRSRDSGRRALHI